MTSNFPIAYDNFPTDKHNLLQNQDDHPTNHNNVGAAINALESEVREGLLLNVKNFHTGVGIGNSNNDTAAMADALAASLSSGKPLYFPPGTLLLDDDILNINATGVLFKGAGAFVSAIKVPDGAFTTGEHHVININDSYRFEIRNIQINGNQANNAGIGSGIKGLGANDGHYERLFVHGCNHGINVETASGHSVAYCWVTDNKTYGLYVATDTDIIGCMVGKNGFNPTGAESWKASNIFIQGWDVRIAKCHLWGTDNLSPIGIYGHYANDVGLNQVIIEEHDKEGILLDGRAANWRVCDCYLEDNGLLAANTYSAIRFQMAGGVGNRGEGCIFTGNRFGASAGSGAVAQAQHKYCIEEDANCDRNLILGNNWYLGYQTAATRIFGASTVVPPGGNLG